MCYYYTTWYGSPDYVAWKKVRADNRSTTGVPRRAQVVVSLAGKVTEGEAGVLFRGTWGNTERSLKYNFEYLHVRSGAQNAAAAIGTPPSTPSAKGQGTANARPAAPAAAANGSKTAAEWPPSGVYKGYFEYDGEKYEEEVS